MIDVLITTKTHACALPKIMFTHLSQCSKKMKILTSSLLASFCLVVCLGELATCKILTRLAKFAKLAVIYTGKI